MSAMIRKTIFSIACLFAVLALSACAGETAESLTSAQQTEPAPAVTAAADAAAPDGEAAAIAAAMTVDYDAETKEHNEASIFLMLVAPHWEPIYVLSRWTEDFTVRDMELELDDALYGSGKASFRGASLDEILHYDERGMFYVQGVSAYDRSGRQYVLSRDDIVEREIYLMAYCEDKLFGFPEDGGVGPLVLMATRDGKAEIIGVNIVNMYIKRSIDGGMSLS